MNEAVNANIAERDNARPEHELAYRHLRNRYPQLAPLFDLTGEVRIQANNKSCIADAVVRIVAGQMLSNRAAEAICDRLNEQAKKHQAPIYRLSHEVIRVCGLSNSKARAITEFGHAFATDPPRFERWANLSYDELRKDVLKLWGLSDWSASMIGLSHFGLPDIWPSADGSIQRAIIRINERLGVDLDPSKGAPYRSYLARTLWAALDGGHLD